MNTHSVAANRTSRPNDLSRRIIFMWAIFLLLTMAWSLYNLRGNWQTLEGFEAEEIAHNIAAGRGFSFPPNSWLFNSSRSTEYYPTAWKEPIYPLLMAAAFKALGAYGRLALLLFQTISLLLTCVVLYYLGRIAFNPWVGLLAGSLLAMLPAAQYTVRGGLGNTPLAGLMMSISVCVILWCLEELSVRKGLALGATLGFTCLTHATALLFIPTSIMLALVSTRFSRPVAWKTATAVLLAAGTVMSPWMIRNWWVFGQFVAVRNGFGQITHLGNPILAETFSPDLNVCSAGSGPPWKAQDCREAIMFVRKKPERIALFHRAFDCIEQDAPPGYDAFNEAERDKVYFKKAQEFALSEPLTFVTMTWHKLLAFFYIGWPRQIRIVTLVALVGVLLTLRNRQARILALLILVYAIPYSLAIPVFYGYRYPIEPIFLVLSSYVIILAASNFTELLRKLV